VRRSLLLPILFPAAVLLVAVAAGFWTVHRLERSLEEDLGRRLEAVAASATDLVDPADVLELELEGESALAYGRLLAELEPPRRAAQASNLFLVSRDGTVLLDLLHPDLVGGPSVLFAAERVAATQALAGMPSTTALYRTGSFRFKTGFAPVRSRGAGVAAVLGVEAGADFFGVLEETRRNLLLALLPAVGAILLLSALFLRLSLSRQRLEREFARAENLAAVGEMAATLAHEVRNPLGVIKRSAERLKRRYSGEESELLDYVSEECDRLATTVRRYLDFARRAPAAETGDAQAAARATVALVESQAREQGVEIAIEAEGSGPWVTRVGSEEWKQILLNLFRNSLEAFGEAQGEAPEGAVPARAAGEPARRILLRLDRPRGGVRLSFEDNGPGMSPETHRRAREPFFTTRALGSGLGLALADRIVRESGGRLALTSRPGQGTKVEIWVPAAKVREGVQA
jgi:signal transduction histidine kinase